MTEKRQVFVAEQGDESDRIEVYARGRQSGDTVYAIYHATRDGKTLTRQDVVVQHDALGLQHALRAIGDDIIRQQTKRRLA